MKIGIKSNISYLKLYFYNELWIGRVFSNEGKVYYNNYDFGWIELTDYSAEWSEQAFENKNDALFSSYEFINQLEK